MLLELNLGVVIKILCKIDTISVFFFKGIFLGLDLGIDT